MWRRQIRQAVCRCYDDPLSALRNDETAAVADSHNGINCAGLVFQSSLLEPMKWPLQSYGASLLWAACAS
jgi:hypothetical protein